MRLTHRSTVSRALLVLLTLLLVFGPGTAAFAATSDDAATSDETTTSDDTTADTTAEQDDNAATATTAQNVEENSTSGAGDTAPTSSGDVTEPQPRSTADDNGTGANVEGPYDSTRDGSDSQNGKGDPEQSNKPCAGCVGKADNKNPPGQMPNGDDLNAGYECDRNQGVGQTNPAHTGCSSVVPQDNPKIHLEKDGPDTAEAGETITYSFTVTNTGNVPLTDVVINDSTLGVTGLHVADELGTDDDPVTVTHDYTVTQADADAGSKKNEATVVGIGPNDERVTDDDDHTFTVPPAKKADIELVKTGMTEARVGDEITYTFEVENTGDVALTEVFINDPLFTPARVEVEDSSLEPGDTTQASATYVVAAADVTTTQAGQRKVDNTATVTGTPVGGGDDVTDTSSWRVLVPSDVGSDAPGIEIVKSASPSTAELGDEITYSFEVTNTGDVDLVDVVITDDKLGITDLAVTSAANPVLSVDESVTVPAPQTYTVTQADVDAGKVDNVAVVTGETDDDGREVTDDDDNRVTVTDDPGDIDVDFDCEGFTVTSSKGISNLVIRLVNDATGETQLVPLEDEFEGKDLREFAYTAPDGWSVVSVWVKSGNNASGELDSFPGAGERFDSDAECDAEIDLIKDGPPRAQVGETITYTFDVENTGDVTLTDVHITDPLLGTGEIAVTPSTLEAGEMGTATATYTVDQADVDANNQVPNTATVTGTPVGDGDDVEAEDDHLVSIDDDAVITVTFDCLGFAVESSETIDEIVVNYTDDTGTLSLTLTDGLGSTFDTTYDGLGIPGDVTVTSISVTAGEDDATAQQFSNDADCDAAIELDKTGPTRAQIGQTITYSFEVENVGDVTLTDVHITDPLLGTDDIAVTPSTLEPGEKGVATATYVVDAAMADAEGVIHNVATVTGTPPRGPDVDDTDDHDVEVTEDVVLTAAFDCLGVSVDASQPLTQVVVNYTVGSNADAVTVTTGFTDGGLRYATTYDALGIPGSAVVTTVVASAGTGDDATQQQFGNDADCDADIVLVKSGPPTTQVGQTITYSFTVTNIGDVTLTDVHVTDPLLGNQEIPVTPSTLAPGDTGTASAPYTVRAEDLDTDGVLRNTATVTGTPPRGDDVSDDDTHDVTIPPTTVSGPNPAIELIKSGPLTARLGDTITYTFTVRNTGDQELTNVHVTDPLLGGEIAVTPSTLPPGAVGVASATYTVRQSDVTAGSILNTATATGTPPGGGTVTDDDRHTTTVPSTPAAPFVSVQTTCEVVSISGTVPITRIVLALDDGSSVVFTGDRIAEAFSSVVTVNGVITGGQIAAGEYPGLVRVDVQSGSASAAADMPANCDEQGPIEGGAPPEDTDEPAPVVEPGPNPPQRPLPDAPPPNPGPRILPPAAGPPPVSQLPATGSDVPTQLLAGLGALLMGLLLVTRTPRPAAAGAAVPETVNGFRRRPVRPGAAFTAAPATGARSAEAGDGAGEREPATARASSPPAHRRRRRHRRMP